MVSFGRFSKSLLTFQSSFLGSCTRQTRPHIHSSIQQRSLSLSSTSSSLFLTFAAAAALSTTSSSSSKCQMNSSSMAMNMKEAEAGIDTGYLNAEDAYELDQHLFDNGYTLEQLMELAGLAVAEAVYELVPLDSDDKAPKRILIVAGPGNNGGDGLVAARHLKLFGYEHVHILYPKRSKKQPHYDKLVTQCEDVGVEFIDEIKMGGREEGGGGGGGRNDYSKYDAIVDAIFGFSFKGLPREPFASILDQMTISQKANGTKIISVDVPSGWNVNEGDVNESGFVPDALISLTAPKLCAKLFHGRHFVGGRFLPPYVAEKYGIRMPPYPGVKQVMEVSGGNLNEVGGVGEEEDNWAAQYAAYCAEKEQNLQDIEAKSTAHDDAPDNDGDEDDWALQYQNYCIEKEAKLAKDDAERKALQKKNDDMS